MHRNWCDRASENGSFREMERQKPPRRASPFMANGKAVRSETRKFRSRSPGNMFSSPHRTGVCLFCPCLDRQGQIHPDIPLLPITGIGGGRSTIHPISNIRKGPTAAFNGGWAFGGRIRVRFWRIPFNVQAEERCAQRERTSD